MRRGFRRGQEIADGLRIEIRDLEDRDDLGPRSSPGSPDSPKSAASTPSPKSTSFPAGATSTTAPAPGITSKPTAQPVIATSVVSSTTLVSSVLPAGTPVIATSKPSSTVRQSRPESTASAIPANGIAEKGGSNGGGGGGGGNGMSKAAIGLGVVGGIGFLVAIVFLIWKFWWVRRKKASSNQAPRAELIANDNARPGNGPGGGLKRSDSSALGSIMGKVYRAEDGGSTSNYQVGGTYMDEKRRLGAQDDQQSILPREPDPVAHPANGDRSESPVGSWLKRQSTNMLNPLTARASMTSSAAGGLKMTEPPRPDDSASQYGGDAGPPTMDPRFQPPVPTMPPQYQPQQATGEYYYPIAIDPQKIPPPPAPQRYSVAETNRTSGTWNTWGVQQHRPGEPKGWKAKLASRQS
ncbi:hypothetical protein PG996_011355 [Apiospora saccharicola]|uniref:Uncharacterized protein n=1 Tax=Apiospora saccharicola TaxID=335842 RepID=A0ABR1UET9_9PEZI